MNEMIDNPDGVAELIDRLKAGDERALVDLIALYRRVVVSAARRFVRDPQDIEDVCQDTWLALLVNLDRIQSQERLAGWLWMTAYRRAQLSVRNATRAIPVEDLDNAAAQIDDVLVELLDAELSSALRRALRSMSPDEQLLIGLLMADPRPGYIQIGQLIGRPIGSLGPTRERVLRKLRRHPEIVRFSSVA